MENIATFDQARELARLCLKCTYAYTARQKQKGLAFECVKNFAEAECPFWGDFQAELRALDANATAASEPWEQEFSAPLTGATIVPSRVGGIAL